MHGRSQDTHVMREAADAIAESWFSTERMKVSSTHASAKLDSTTMIGE